jgi:hypothetical protein
MNILPYPDGRPRKMILVIGDWLVDEYWVVGVQRSKTSSRVGRAHFRALQSPECTVTSFCGAGRTAAILHRAKSGDDDNIFGIVGLGVWNGDDQPALEAMLDSASVEGLTPHEVCHSFRATSGKKRKLVNLVHNASPVFLNGTQPSTTKVIRIYSHTGQDIDLRERIDWEVKIPENGWVSKDCVVSHPDLGKLLESRVDAVVVKDLLKGTVTPALVDFVQGCLKKKDEDTPWFISSKGYLPEWMGRIDAESIQLLEIPQAAAQDAVRKEKLDAWLTRSGEPSKEALGLIDQLAEKHPKALIVAVPNDQAVLAHWQKPAPTEKQGVFWTASQQRRPSVGLPMASVCFAAFVAYCLEKRTFELAELVEASLAFTENWRSFEANRILEPLSWNPVDEPCLDVDHRPVESDLPSAFSWQDARRRWDEAYAGCGVINDNGEARLELSRATTEVRNYVCIDSSKRNALRKIVHEVEVFKSGSGSRSCMMIAPPGSGKSLLAQLIAKDHGLYFLEFNITQMITKADILDCFDVMLTTQFGNRGKQLLVFVDEIDACLQNDAVYDTFLAPLEGGIYRRAGKTFPLEPCFWLFAGTTDPTKSGNKKASDFVSRLTLKPIEMVRGATDEYKLENVYLGAAILRAEFLDVHEVSTHVLQAFRQLDKEMSIREIRRFIKSFEDVKLGEVRWENLPKEWKARFTPPTDNEVMVEITGDVVGPDVLARFRTAPISAVTAKAG